MKGFIYFLVVIFGIGFIGFQILKYQKAKRIKHGTVMFIPTTAQMTREELDRNDLLFGGEVLVRVHVHEPDADITAVSMLGHPVPEVGDGVSISNFMNGNEYLIQN